MVLDDDDDDDGGRGVHVDDQNAVGRERWSSHMAFLLAGMGAAIGLGNVWRFPFLVYENGGGAFLVPYFFALAVLGLPLLLLELSLGQKAQTTVVNALRAINPRLGGVGWLMIAGAFLVVCYYNMIMSWSFIYLFESFKGSPLPWSNDPQGYFDHEILGMSETDTIGSVSSLNGYAVLGSAVTWLIVYFSVRKGVKSSAWVVYVTVPLPFIILFILLIRGATLPGASEGIRYYMQPDFAKVFTQPKIWTEAATQIFFSISIGAGVMPAFASFNDRRQNVVRDTLVIAITNSLTSFAAGFVVFSVLGHMAQQQNVSVKDVVRSGPGLAFVAFPKALTLMPAAPFFSVCFFVMLLCLGIDSAFALTESITAVMKDVFRPGRYEQHMVAGVCTVGFLSGLIYATNAGLYWLDLVDHFVSSFLFLPIGIVECLAIGWMYGAREHLADLRRMTGVHMSDVWRILWRYVAPIVMIAALLVELIAEFIGHDNTFPDWALAIGWLVVLVPSSGAVYYAFVRHGQHHEFTDDHEFEHEHGHGHGNEHGDIALHMGEIR